MKHHLKILPAYYEAVISGDKRFEIRDNTDRGFQKGDTIILMEYAPYSHSSGGYSGRESAVEITYVTNYAQTEGFVVFGFK